VFPDFEAEFGGEVGEEVEIIETLHCDKQSESDDCFEARWYKNYAVVQIELMRFIRLWRLPGSEIGRVISVVTLRSFEFEA